VRNEGLSALLAVILSSGQHGTCCKSVLQDGSGKLRLEKELLGFRKLVNPSGSGKDSYLHPSW